MHKTLIALSLMVLASNAVSAQTTTFSYQGKLTLNGVPVNGLTDLRFTLYNVESGGAAIAGPYDVADQQVTAGLVRTPVNFGLAFDGGSRWLEIAVRPGDSIGAFTTLTPRQQILSAPYALRARSMSGSGIESAIGLPQSSPSAVAYGFYGDSNTGMFSPTYNELGFATTGIEALHIDGSGRVGVNRVTNLLYRFTIADNNHQMAIVDTDDAKLWTLTTVSGGGFGIYQDGSTARLTINAAGTVAVEGGKAVVYNSNGTELMTLRATAILSTNSLPANTGVDGVLTWNNQGFTSPPMVLVGSFEPGPSGLQDFDHFTVTCHSVTTTGCKVRLFNAGSTPATVTQGKWSVIIIGPRN